MNDAEALSAIFEADGNTFGGDSRHAARGVPVLRCFIWCSLLLPDPCDGRDP
jgi:hypothetical protein